MDKKEALSAIYSSLEKFRQNLLNCNILFIYESNKQISFIETVFLKRHFLHLTGAVIDEKRIKSAVEFFNICSRKQLYTNAFEFSDDGTTVKKLEVLQHLMDIQKYSKMTGYYNGNYVNLQTERIVGNVRACLGFIYDKELGYYIPNTALKEDCRNVIAGSPFKIVAILKKPNNTKYYTEMCYGKPDIDFEMIKSIEGVYINI